MTPPEPLKLVALDAEDLAVLSAHLQDAVLKIGDIAWRPKEHRFALAMNRFDWENAVAGDFKSPCYRRRSLLHFDRVLAVRSSRIRRDDPDAVVEILAIAFEPASPDAPNGAVTLHLAGGGAIRLEVECLEARLTDLDTAWQARAVPVHDLAVEDPNPEPLRQA